MGNNKKNKAKKIAETKEKNQASAFTKENAGYEKANSTKENDENDPVKMSAVKDTENRPGQTNEAVNTGKKDVFKPAKENGGKSAGNKRIKPGSVILGAVIGIVITICIGIAAVAYISSGSINYANIFVKMRSIQALIDNQYLYDIDSQNIEDGIFSGLLYGLDQDNYAVYYSPEDYEQLRKQEDGSYVGIGVTVMQDEETGALSVVSVYSGGPAEEAGLLKGDLITSADGIDLTELSTSDAVSYITGEKGTEVVLTYIRDGEEYEITLIRDEVTIESVHYKVFSDEEFRSSRMGGMSLGYISINDFLGNTAQAFEDAFEYLTQDEEVDGVIIDLRNNSGGDMNVCLRMLDFLIDDYTDDEDGDTLLLTVENKEGGMVEYFTSDGIGTEVPIVVLVNEMSASASEIFAGTLKDYGIEVVGTTTYGKGTVQILQGLSDGSAVKFTAQQYKLPKGGYVQGVGVEPTVEVTFEHSDGVEWDSVNYASGEEEPAMQNDSQIKAAMTLLEEMIYNAFQEQ